MAKRKLPRSLREPRVKVAYDSVTGNLVSRIEDAVTRAADRAAGAVETACRRLPTTAASELRYAVVREALAVLGLVESAGCADLLTVRVEGAPDLPEPFATVAREYAALVNASDRTRFVDGVREQLTGMLKHTGGAGHAFGLREAKKGDAA